MTAHLTHYSKFNPPSLWQHCIHLHGNIVTVRAGVGNCGKIGYKMDRLLILIYLLQRLSEEDSNRARLGAGEEVETNMQG